MRAITNDSINAFVQGVNFKKANMRVENIKDETFLYLHDNMIANKNKDTLFITTCGWETNTTKERLNGILNRYNLGKIVQKRGVWYLNNEEFNGKKIFKL